MKIINCCDHNVVICDACGNIIKVYEPSGNHARVKHTFRSEGMIDGVLISVREDKTIVGLPEPEEETYYIVSNICANALPERKDLLVAGPKIRDNRGKIIGWKSFVRNGERA